jgi:hypothetical protein
MKISELRKKQIEVDQELHKELKKFDHHAEDLPRHLDGGALGKITNLAIHIYNHRIDMNELYTDYLPKVNFRGCFTAGAEYRLAEEHILKAWKGLDLSDKRLVLKAIFMGNGYFDTDF